MDTILRDGLDPESGEAIVMKVRLRTFTLGHYFLLQELDSPFLNSLKPVEQPHDLLRAVLICSQFYQEARKRLVSRSTMVFLIILGMLNRRSKPMVEEQRFMRYLEANRELPAMRRRPGGNPRYAPEPWRLLVMLLRDFRMDLAEALDTTVRQANCLWAVSAELDGAVELMPSDPFNNERLRCLQERAAQRLKDSDPDQANANPT